MPLPVNTLPASALVKEASQPLHSSVEALLLPKLEALHSRAGYAAILKMFYGYFFPLEKLLQQHLSSAQLPDLSQRRKAAAILHDLAAIGEPVAGLPLCQHLPEIKNSTQALGALYVLEGSTLGGKMIVRMLLKNEALSLSEDAVTFFSGYKEDTGKKWKTFLEVFNQQEFSEPLLQSVNDTFAYLKSWMQQSLYHE